MKNYILHKETKPAPKECARLAKITLSRLYVFLEPLLETLNQVLDKRLVRTFYHLFVSILSLENSRHSLLVTRLGAHFLGEHQGWAGMKRIHRLLDSQKWMSTLLDNFFEQQAVAFATEVVASGKWLLALWDDGEIEKHETEKGEGLCPVRSSKFKRLIRIRKGYYDPPTTKPAFVAGLHWLTVLLSGMDTAPILFRSDCWSHRGPQAEGWYDRHVRLLKRCQELLGDTALHVFDRGFAATRWLSFLIGLQCRFLIRWNGHYILLNSAGVKKKTCYLSIGKKATSTRMVWDMKQQVYRKAGVLWMRVTHPAYPDVPLTLIICRSGKMGRSPWYLLTSERVENSRHAWKLVFAYSRRWLVESTFRYNKAELGIESIRVMTWEKRMKFIKIVMLVYLFLLWLMHLRKGVLVVLILKHTSDKKGKRYRIASIPLYRLRDALIFLMKQEFG
ncbi:transposase [Limibacter armeniacum]|uniref:transposase n=1 Tax=Limibacter armeniacum TaxID=466084 RepID=UPI002FE53757